MNHIMTFLLFFSPEKMIYSHHLMYAREKVDKR
jgi:hypothetical protein